MISQRCPVCQSSRIRRGYRPTPFWAKILFRYNLLCDNCNWEFMGFALPGFISTKQTKSSRDKKETGKLKQGTVGSNKDKAEAEMNRDTESEPIRKPEPRTKKKVKIKI